MKRIPTLILSLAILCGLLAVPGGIVRASQPPDWQQVNAAPNPPMASITSLVEFKGLIYAGTSAPYPYGEDHVQAAVYRSIDGARWEKVTQDGFGDPFNNKHIWSMAVFKGQLYAGGGGFWESTPDGAILRHLQLWRSSDGLTWEAVSTDGFGDPDNLWVQNLIVMDGQLYTIGAGLIFGFQIYRSRSGDPGSWVKVTTQFDDPNALYYSDGIAMFKGRLFLSAEGFGSRQQIFSTRDGLQWDAASPENFGLSETVWAAGGLSVYQGYLYAGLGLESGGQIWRTQDGQSWTQVISAGFGDTNNWNIKAFIPYQGDLYAMTNNNASGSEVWLTHDGLNWEQVNQDGFNGVCTHDEWGSPLDCNTGNFANIGALVYKNALYLGTMNQSQGQIWRTAQMDS